MLQEPDRTGSGKTGCSNWFWGCIGPVEGFKPVMISFVSKPVISAKGTDWFCMESYSQQWGPLKLNLKKERIHQLLNMTLESSNIVLDDIDASSELVVETQRPTFDNEDLSWMDLDPLP
jgi:hypothetical protein